MLQLDDFIVNLHGHDTVILVLTGIGETKYSTKEVYKAIESELPVHCKECIYRNTTSCPMCNRVRVKDGYYCYFGKNKNCV